MHEGRPMSSKLKTIAVSPEVYERLVEFGRKGQSFDDILRHMLGLKEVPAT